MIDHKRSQTAGGTINPSFRGRWEVCARPESDTPIQRRDGGAADADRSLDERTLVEAARHGDESAVETLYRTYHEKIYRYVLYRLGDYSAAEDVTSQVFLGMVKGLPRFRWQGRPFVAWLYGIAQKQIAYHYRVFSAEADSADPDGAYVAGTDAAGPHAFAEAGEERERLAAAMRMLPESQREAVILRYVLSLPLDQTAAAMGRSEGAVKQLQVRGLSTLRDVLGEDEARRGGRSAANLP